LLRLLHLEVQALCFEIQSLHLEWQTLTMHWRMNHVRVSEEMS
jgi:hypothetical protein